MLSVWKHFTLCNLLFLGEMKDFVQVGLGGALFFPKCVVYLFLQRWCTQFPLIVHIPASSCSHLSWTLAPFPLARPGRTGQGRTAPPQRCRARAPAVLPALSGWAEGEVVIKNKRKKAKKGLWAIPCCSQATQGVSRALRWLLEWQHTKSLSPLRCASCVHLPICAGKMNMSKFTASFRFQGTERKRVQAAREGRSRCLWRLCCSQSVMTLLSAVKLCCPGRTDCKVHLVNVE